MATLSVLKEREGVFNKIKSKKKSQRTVRTKYLFFFLENGLFGSEWAMGLFVVRHDESSTKKCPLVVA